LYDDPFRLNCAYSALFALAWRFAGKLMNRKLIRPNLGEIKEKMGRRSTPRAKDTKSAGTSCEVPTGSVNSANSNAATIPQGSSSPRRRIAPPEQTNAESFYYIKQMQAKTPMVVVLQDGEKIRGVIEWYDKHCIKVNRIKEPNILLPKHNIKYLYKQEEEPRMRRIRGEKKDDVAERPELDVSLYDNNITI